MALQGSTHLIFGFTDFCACKDGVMGMFCVHKTVTVSLKLRYLMYNVLIDIVFPIYFAIS